MSSGTTRDISDNVDPVKLFLRELLRPLLGVRSFDDLFRTSALRPRLACNLSVGVSVRPKHLFDQNFDHDYYCELSLTRERDAQSFGQRFCSRHVRLRAVPRAY